MTLGPSTLVPIADPRDDLYPTRTRLDLLEAVAAGDVREGPGGVIRRSWPGGTRIVTDKVHEMHRAGWVTAAEPVDADGGRPVAVTATGRKRLAPGPR